ncbi:MAG TPA: PAS domain-containing protein, partial [Thermoanaerobaculia bacterium]|nr:PAS domain-containing protein [Thermoanaerobaculia bacterium]
MPEAPYEESAEDLYDNAPCGYLSTLPGGIIVKVNQTFLTWTGYERHDLVGRKRFQELLSPGGRIYHETHYAPLLQMQGTVREIAVDIVCATGQRLPALINSVLRKDAAGKPALIRTTVFNATDRKEYERELLRERQRAERAAQ